MAKVFRPYGINRTTANAGWFDSVVYNPQTISEIKDPEGGTPNKAITSIPSPFARMDLVMTAFEEVNKLVADADKQHLSQDNLRGILDGDRHPTMYHRLVSEVFDVAEIFFNIEHLRDRFEIIVWDKSQDIDVTNPFGQTIKMFLEADAQAYNFDQMERLYLLRYKGEGRESDMDIVGATSPVTMFFSTDNELPYVAKNVAFGNDRPFDSQYTPLFKRDVDFVKYLYAFRKADAQFANHFRALNTYLDYTYRALSDNQKQEVDAIGATSITAYNAISVGGDQANVVEVLGRPLHTKIYDLNWESAFYINSLIYADEKVPLVLPVESGNKYANWQYTTDTWGKTRRAPYKCDTPWRCRSLPDVNVDYPYLTISDFLGDTIVRIKSELNNSYFYDGGYKSDKEDEDCRDSYLLPLTDTFFTFFSAEELVGKNMITIKELVRIEDDEESIGSVKVLLKVPVGGRSGVVEYSRIYSEKQMPDANKNEGTLINANMGLGIMPLVKFAEGVDSHYRIAYFDKEMCDTSLSFYEGPSINELQVEGSAKKCAKDLKLRVYGHEAFALNHNFDRIKVRIGDSYNFIVPKFIKENHGSNYTFAIDFGTTNTHIEYCTSDNPNPTPFKISNDEVQMHKLHKNYSAADLNSAFEQDFVPETIGQDTDRYRFPIRTALSERKGINYDATTLPLCDGYIPFQYEDKPTPTWNVVRTELKWSGTGDDDSKRLALNIETLFILIRNKVILGGGNLATTRIVWFYPASMTLGKVNRFSQIWNSAYKKYFGDNAGNLIAISESIAPVLNFQAAPGNVITIDVGGGTTDVFVVESDKGKMLLSFRFASNAIFGDAWKGDPQNNGFIKRYLGDYKSKLKANKKGDLLNSLEEIENQRKSTDIVAFMFSCVGEKVDRNQSLYFIQSLIDDGSMRYVFILFYGSIFYYIAHAMKAKGIKKPEAICFSGNGSRTVDVLSTNFNYVAEFAKMFFDDAYGDTKGFIRVERETSPKTATSKGGIKAVMRPVRDSETQLMNYEYDPDIKMVFVGDDFNAVSPCKLKYNDINDAIKTSVVDSVTNFIDKLFELNASHGNILVKKLDADSQKIALVKKYCLSDEGKQTLMDSLEKGLKDKKEKDNVVDDAELEETLFFYPLVGLLHDLALKLSE